MEPKLPNSIVWMVAAIITVGIGTALFWDHSPPPSLEITPSPITHPQPVSTVSTRGDIPPGAGTYISVQISGAVRHPGLFRVMKGTRVNEALSLAGGILPSADDSHVNYVAKIRDGQRINLPHRDPIPHDPTDRRHRRNTPQDPDAQFNIDNATATQIQSHYGISKRGARAITHYRSVMGWIQSETELPHVPNLPSNDIAILSQRLNHP